MYAIVFFLCVFFFFNVAETWYRVEKCVRNRLAALATHGRQNCKQSGVVLERTVQQIVRLIHGRIKGVISRK